MPRILRRFAGRKEWFEIKNGMIFEVCEGETKGQRWKVVKTPFDGHGTARMVRLTPLGHETDVRDTVLWNELFSHSKLIDL